MKILLVEPNYKNKYPPMGLMKLSTYHKERGDTVIFYKGIMPYEEFSKLSLDRVYITSLFTFYYSLTVKTISEYEQMIFPGSIFVGGILASLMSQKLKNDINKEVHIIAGQLTSSSSLGLGDNQNIDILPLDYDILDDIDYRYPAGANYFAYITRGCTNTCPFCAVPKLEPQFCLTNNVINQVSSIKQSYGEKQNLLLLDNNILSLPLNDLQKAVLDIHNLGFDKETKFFKELPFSVFMKKLSRLSRSSKGYSRVSNELIAYLHLKASMKMSSNYRKKYDQIIQSIDESTDKISVVRENFDVLMEILSYYYRPAGSKRSVDFNQGIDARQLNCDNMMVLSTLPIEPFRLAFDSMEYAVVYENAIRLAHQYGVSSFSNYLLYNFNDNPDDLWYRLNLNVSLVKELNVKIFSFPMKYAPINRTDRSYVGKEWNRHFLSNIYAILNVTKGIVAGGQEFFHKAFGNNIEEYHEVLSMPRNFIIYRSKHESIGLTEQWRQEYRLLSHDEKNELLDVLSSNMTTSCRKVINILKYYSKDL